MASCKRTSILEGMFWDICTPDEQAKVDELYKKGHKASATVYMLKRVREKWCELINAEHKQRAARAIVATDRQAHIGYETNRSIIHAL